MSISHDNPDVSLAVHGTANCILTPSDESIHQNPISVSTERTKFDIRDHLDKLTPAKGKNRYICPVCEGNNMTVDPNTAEYQCWNGCECKDIRETVAPWEQVKGKNKTHQPIGSRKPILKPKPPKPAIIPEGQHSLAKLPDPVTHPEKRKRGNRTEIEYTYSETQWVLRVEKPNPKKAKGYEKDYFPHHIDTEGNSKRGKGDAVWDAYRINEVLKYGAGKWVTADEGEPCVEAVRYLGLVNFTFQGSDWSDASLEKAAAQIKEGGITGILYLPDNDDTGYKKAAALSKACAKAQLPFVPLDLNTLWKECPENGDVADWVRWGMEQGWNKEEFVKRLEEQFKAAIEQEQAKESSNSDKNWDEVNEEIPDSFNPKSEFTQITLDVLYGDKPWICTDDKLYYWDKTHYKYSKDVIEVKRIADWCNTYVVPNQNPKTNEVTLTYPYAKPSKVRQILEWVKMRLSIDPDLVNPPGLNCTNGVLQIKWSAVELNPLPQWKITNHTPNLYYTYEPLVKYDPEADSKSCDRLLEVLEPAQRDIFLKTIAASLDLTTVRQYKGRLVRILLLKGHGSNGKDTLREAVSLMYGQQGMTGCTLSDFAMYDEGRKFPLARLEHSRCNWASENANTARLDKIQSLKAFGTGDKLSKEGKGKDETEFTPTGIALFNINDTPKMQGTLEAIASRYGVLSFNKTFKIGADPSKGELEADPRFKYDPNFLRAEVLPAFLNRVLDALQKLMIEGIDYSCTQKALEDIQAENSHLFQFSQDVGLGYVPNSNLTAGDIWERLEQWYQDNGTLAYEETSTGKQKAIWTEQANPYDRNIKGANQVLGRFQQLFPKCKRVTIPHHGGKKMVQALQGIGFIGSDEPPDGNCDNNPESPTAIPPQPTPVPPQFPPQKTTENQCLHPSYPNFSYPIEKKENELTDCSNVLSSIEKSRNSSQELGWVGCDALESTISGVGIGVEIGVEIAETGVEAIALDTEASVTSDISPELLAMLICDAQSWAEVDKIIAAAPELKKQVWMLLPDEQKDRIKNLKEIANEVKNAKHKEEELLMNGEAVGRLVRMIDLKGIASDELFEIESWCDRNGFYRLTNGDIAYPCNLRIAADQNSEINLIAQDLTTA